MGKVIDLDEYKKAHNKPPKLTAEEYQIYFDLLGYEMIPVRNISCDYSFLMFNREIYKKIT